jgi:hypothetical protein
MRSQPKVGGVKGSAAEQFVLSKLANSKVGGVKGSAAEQFVLSKLANSALCALSYDRILNCEERFSLCGFGYFHRGRPQN